MMTRKLLILGLASVVSLLAQNRTRFGGMYVAADYAYGLATTVPALRVAAGNAAAGAATITVQVGFTVLGDGTKIFPLAITAPIVIGVGPNAETVTPSAVSCASDAQNSCTFTATFANIHGYGDFITTGTAGFEECVNDANKRGGGLVLIDNNFVRFGGVNATVTGNKGFTNVSVLDGRGTVSGSAFSFKAASNGANYAATTISWY